jgi:hypothetical protein
MDPAHSPDPAHSRPFAGSIAALLATLEELSRAHPERLLRLRGHLPVNGAGDPDAAGDGLEPFELLIFRGFSSSTTHPTAFDPDRPALPEGSCIESAELLQGPLRPPEETVLAGPGPVQPFLEPHLWRGRHPAPQLDAEV